MPYHRRNKKRHRNKSSPQIVSSPKKYRQSENVRDEIIELTDQTDSASTVDDSDMNSTMDAGENTQSEPTAVQPGMGMGASPAVSEQGLDMSQNILRNTQHQYMNGASQYFGNVGPGIMDPGMMPPAHNMNFPPQQMLNFAQPMQQSAHMQHFPQAPHGSQLSEDDVLRIATKLKAMLREEINDLIEQRVALAVEPLRIEVDAMKETLTKVQTDLKQAIVRSDDLEQYSRRSCLRISGIVESANEDTTKLVLDLAERVGANIDPTDIDRSHRVGRIRDENDISDEPRMPPRAREIIIKFNNYSARLKLLKGRATLREQKAKVYINVYII